MWETCLESLVVSLPGTRDAPLLLPADLTDKMSASAKRTAQFAGQACGFAAKMKQMQQQQAQQQQEALPKLPTGPL